MDRSVLEFDGGTEKKRPIVNALLQIQAKEDGSSSRTPLSGLKPLLRRNQYDLVGVVVHSGQANAGHYYSYIKVSKQRIFDYPKLVH